MCTVVFIPGKEKYFFGSLRDEDPARERALAPGRISLDGHCFIAPKDPVGGGTWAGANERADVIILLNGGFKNHAKKTVYAKSRGLIVMELLAEAMPVIEWNLMNLDNIEPFTLIVWSDKKLFQLVWDGEYKHRINLPVDTAHIWSSSTLYTDEIKNYREYLFKKWINGTTKISRNSLLHFFEQYKDAHNGFIMSRDEKIRTLSYTFIETQPAKATAMQYTDLLSGATSTASIIIQPKAKKFSCP